jgi:hypothetical protein
MSETPVGKRRFHAFLSHAHVDKDQADHLFKWLQDVAGMPIWYDAVNMPPGATIAQALPEAIENSRSILLLLSKRSVSRGWVQQEFNAAINHQTRFRAFRIIPVRLDDVDPPGFLQNYSNISLGASGINMESAANILKGLYQPATAVDPINGRNVYVSRGWHASDAPLAHAVCAALSDAGLQLIGDAEDQPSWIEARVAGVIEGCGAFAAILPHRPYSAYKTSKYVLREWELAASRGLPCLVVADPRVDPPSEAAGWPGLVQLTHGSDLGSYQIAERAVTLAEDWRTPARSPYVFYATAFEAESKSMRRIVEELVEAVTTLPCILGEYLKGDVVQREILRSVTEAALVLADVSKNAANVYVELGAARAVNVPVAILRQGPPGRPVFMLRDQQVWDYSTDADLLGRIVRIIYPYRRSLLTSRDL